MLNTANPRYPRRLQTDMFKEIFNSNIQALMKRNSIQHFARESEQMAAVVKRVNLTIKNRIWTYLSDRDTVCWVNAMLEMVNAYNHLHHRSIGMAPTNVQKKDELRLWVRLFWEGDTHLKPTILQGAMVRARINKTIFINGYMPNWTKEHFTVSQGVPPIRLTKRRLYKFVNYNNEAVRSNWYPKKQQ